MAIRFDEDAGKYFKTSEDEPPVEVVPDPTGDGWITVGSPAYFQAQYQAPNYANYDQALAQYSAKKVPWNYTALRGETGYGTAESQGGLSTREAFNLNALWGATQYAQGRVTDFSHIDPTQLQANQVAGTTRDQLWDTYNQLVAQGNAPAKNPDQVALDFYVQTVGPQGNQYGYGPGANTILVTEAIKNKFLNQPEVVRATGQQYATPEAQLAAAREFGAAHEAGVPVWQVFEQQGYSRDLLGSLMPMILGAMIFPGLGTALSGALGGGVAGQIAAASIIGGVNAELQGGNFIDGAIKAALTAGTGAAIANVGIAAEVSSALKSLDFAPDVADLVAKTAERAVTSAVVAEATGGNAADAVANVLLSAGVSVARSELGDIVSNVTAAEAPAEVDAATLESAATDLTAAPQEISNVAPQQPEVVATAPEAVVTPEIPQVPEGPVTPTEIISEIQPETVATTPAIDQVVSRETTAATPEVVAEAVPEAITPTQQPVTEVVPVDAGPVTTEEILQEIVPDVVPEVIPEAPTEVTPEVAPETAPEVVPEVVPEPAPEATPEEPVISDQDLLQALVDEGLLPGTEVTPEEAAPVEPAPEEVAPTEPTTPAETPAEPSLVPEEPAAVELVTPSEPAAELPLEVAPVEEAPVSDQDLLQALVDEGLLPAEAVTPETVAPEVAPQAPAEELPPEEIVVEPAPVEEAPALVEEPLPEEQPIPEALPDVEPEPVLPEPAPEEPAPAEEPLPAEEAPIGDQDVMQAIADEAQAPAEETPPEEEPAPAEPGPEAPAVEEPPTEEPATETPAETPATTAGPSEIDRLIAQLLLGDRGGAAAPQRRSTTQESVSPREISGSVTGIIGKKQPMFGGDEDAQTAEWNRRSLRLRKILGL